MAEADAVPDLSKVVCMFCLNAEGLQNPKSLPCSHIYCLKCVTKYYEVNGIIRCPLCRENFAETPESLPSAYQVAVVDHSILCDVCTAKGLEKKPAVTYCTKCSKLFCAKHQHSHDDTLKEHSRINVNVYKRQAEQLQPRMCSEHKDFPYSMGCRTCLTAVCIKCISGGGACTGGSGHQLLTLDELVTELTTVDQIHDKEDKLDDLFKLMSNIIADFDTETDGLQTMLHKQRDEQLKAIGLKYQKLEKELLERRACTKSSMVEFMEENVGMKLSDLYISRMRIQAQIEHSHQVDFLKRYEDTRKEMKKSIPDELPTLELQDMVTLEVKDEKRELEVEVVAGKSAFISLESGLTTSAPLPKSMTLLQTVRVSGWCYSVYQYQGNTYVRLFHGAVDKIDGSYQLSKSFLTPGSLVLGVTVYNERVYTLVRGDPKYTVHVHDLTGRLITNWAHTDSTGGYANKFAIVGKLIIIPDRLNKLLSVYSLTGEVMKHLPCPLLSNGNVAICAADTNSVIISDWDSSQVFKVDISTGDISWTVKHITEPQGVTCYKNRVFVANCSTTTRVWILDEKTGELLTEISDPAVRYNSHVLDLQISGNTLIVPRCHESIVLFYELN